MNAPEGVDHGLEVKVAHYFIRHLPGEWLIRKVANALKTEVDSIEQQRRPDSEELYLEH